MADTKTAPKKADKNVWTDEERAAMQAGARERKASAKLTPEQERAAGEQELRAKLADMPADDRAMGERIHEVVMAAVPAFVPKTYYGMPAYAKDGRTLCFYKPKSKFKVRYSTFGFQPDAKLDDGDMWATEFAVIELTPKVEQRIAELVKKAAG
jgi:uncharacterized protein YdhG (YjbR/CyaY superfamily)